MLAQASPALHIFEISGKLANAWGEQLGGAHGLTHVIEDGIEYLWITDQMSGEVSKRDLEGNVHQHIPAPLCIGKTYSPTCVAISPVEGDIWVADGYGSNVIRRYSKQGDLLGELTGEEGPGLFARPHGIAFHPNGTLLVADRRNKRIVVYDAEGRYLFHRDEIAHSPCGFAFHGDAILVPELFGDLKVLVSSLDLVTSYGTNFDVRPRGGWTRQEGWGWPESSDWPDRIPPRNPPAFVAPHAAAVASDGTIYVAEWIKKGRVVRLKHVPD